MIRRPRVSKWQGFRYKLAAPYALAFVALAGIGFQLNSSLFAETTLQGDIRLTTDKAVYHTGDTVRFTITNDTPATISVANNCPAEPLEVYRQVDGQWQRIHDKVDYDSKCDGEPRQYSIKPNGGSASATYVYWDNLFTTAGKYKLVAPLQGVENRPETEFNVVGSN